jgi:hypothetical protein
VTGQPFTDLLEAEGVVGSRMIGAARDPRGDRSGSGTGRDGGDATTATAAPAMPFPPIRRSADPPPRPDALTRSYRLSRSSGI